MKNLLVILIPFLLFRINNCFAQKDSIAEKKFDRFYISLTGGMSIPVGQFDEMDSKFKMLSSAKLWPSYQNLADGVQNGISGKLSIAYFFIENLGCIGSASLNSFKVKDKTLDDVVQEGVKNYYKEDSEFLFDAKSWKANNYMIGLAARLAFGKFSCSIRFLAGTQHTIMPETNLKLIKNYYPATEIQSIRQLTSSSSGFAWNPGLDIQFKPSKKIGILVSADYTTSKCKFKEVDEVIVKYSYYPLNHHDVILPYEFKKTVSCISLTAGIAYVFK